MIKKLFFAASLVFFPALSHSATIQLIHESTGSIQAAPRQNAQVKLSTGIFNVLIATNVSVVNGLTVSTTGVAQPIFEVATTSADFTMNGSSMVVITPTDVAIKGLLTPPSTNYSGELISTTVARASQVALSNGVDKTIFQYTLQPGIYDAFPQCGFSGSGVSTILECCLSTVSATCPGTTAFAIPNRNQIDIRLPSLSVATADAVFGGFVPISVANGTTLTVYLVTNCTFPSGTCNGYGSIMFRRK